MKCPKCDYLGFETGDRCKNCGYDFSLIETPDPDEIEVDLTLHLAADASPDAPVPELILRKPQAAAAPQRAYETPLPLFARSSDDASDEPLIKLPAAPRAPLSVRRTPDTPRLRAVPKPGPKPAPRITPEPVLEFVDEPPAAVEPPPPPRPSRTIVPGEISRPSLRLAAAAVDHALLLAIDLVVVYFTLRMAGLSTSEWQTLPVAPLLTFLILLKLSYFCAFTAVGGQTIGKMAMGIRVVTDEGTAVDGPCAARRTIAGALSTMALGLGFIPAFVGSDRRALHDRVAHTRVIALRSA